jgi:hypothetical protein
MLIISTIKEIPVTKSMSIARAIYMILGVIFAFVLMGIGPEITFPTIETTTRSVNTTEVWTDVQTASISITNGTVWMAAHLMIGAFLILYVIQQTVMLFFKTDT